MWTFCNEEGQLVRDQDQHVPVRMKIKDNKVWEPWMTNDTVRLKETKKHMSGLGSLSLSRHPRNIQEVG